VTTSLKYPAFIKKKWLDSYRASSTYYRRHPASTMLFLRVAGQKRQLNRKPKKKKPLNYEISIDTNYPVI
jgi:hypothetical protein